MARDSSYPKLRGADMSDDQTSMITFTGSYRLMCFNKMQIEFAAL